MGCVYLVQNLANEKNYVGQTVKASLQERYRSFSKPCIDRGLRPIDRAFLKHGGKSFVFHSLLTGVPKDQLDFWERFFIKAFDTTTKGYGYNLESGGNKKKQMAEETKLKISLANKGRPLTPEHREHLKRMAEKRKGVPNPWSAERKNRYTVQSHPLYTRRNWVHPTHGKVTCSIVELIAKFPEQKLSRGNLCTVAKGYPSRFQHKGWTTQEQLALNRKRRINQWA